MYITYMKRRKLIFYKRATKKVRDKSCENIMFHFIDRSNGAGRFLYFSCEFVSSREGKVEVYYFDEIQKHNTEVLY